MTTLFRFVLSLTCVAGIILLAKHMVFELMEGNIFAMLYPSAFIVAVLMFNELISIFHTSVRQTSSAKQ